MTDTQTAPAIATLSTTDRLAILLACILVGGIFCTVGWLVVAPPDPLGAVTLLSVRSAILAVIKLSCLAAIGSALTTVILRARVADAGVFVVCVALAAMDTRGANVDFLARFIPDDLTRSGMLAALAGETMGWLIVVLVAAVAGEAVARWFLADGSMAYGRGHVAVGQLLLARSSRHKPIDASELRSGLLCLLICVAAGAMVIRLTGGTVLLAIRKGQVDFSVVVGFFVATLLGHQITRARLAIWPLLAVPIVAAAGYLAGAVKPIAGVDATYQAIDHVMPNFVCRVLPIEYLALGSIGVLGGLWISTQMVEGSRHEHKPPEAQPVKGR